MSTMDGPPREVSIVDRVSFLFFFLEKSREYIYVTPFTLHCSWASLSRQLEAARRHLHVFYLKMWYRSMHSFPRAGGAKMESILKKKKKQFNVSSSIKRFSLHFLFSSNTLLCHTTIMFRKRVAILISLI